MPLYTVTYYLPEHTRPFFRELAGKFTGFTRIFPDPHITIVNPFFPRVPISEITREMRNLAFRMAPVPVTYRGIACFQDTKNALYYLAVADAKPLLGLHYAAYALVSDMIDDLYQGRYNLVGFVPHVTLGSVSIDIKNKVDMAIAGYPVEFDAELDRYALCVENKDRTWTTLQTFLFAAPPR